MSDCLSNIITLYILGNIKLNPFVFKNHDVQNITFKVRGELYPRVPYDLNFQENDFHRAYMDYMHAIGVGRSNNSPNITMEAYKKYCTIFALDLESDSCNSSHIHESKTGSIDVSFAFRTAPTANLTVCFFSLHDYCITFQREEGKPRLKIENVDANLLLAEK